MRSSRWFLGLLTVVIVGGFLAWQAPRWAGQPALDEAAAQPRPIAVRGELAADEKATIELFERSKASVVYISTTARVLDLFSRITVAHRRPPPLPIGTSADLKVGQKAFAIGNPFGLDWSLTTGIVSALDRALPDEDGKGVLEHMIQTDAAINPGNSGGPLLDSSGRLIGINSALCSPSGAYAGIGFAVPVDTVNRVVPQLIAQGKYVRPVLGIE